MGMLLTADDLAPEMYVTVHSAKPLFSHAPNRGGAREPQISPAMLPIQPGIPLRVLGVSLPFVACSILNPGGTYSGPVILDVRMVHLSRLNSDYIGAIIAFDDAGDVPEIDDHEDCLGMDGVSSLQD